MKVAATLGIVLVLVLVLGMAATGDIILNLPRLAQNAFTPDGLAPPPTGEPIWWVNDIVGDVPLDETWLQTQLILALTTGTIYQDSFGDASGGPPNTALLGLTGFESLQYDTYMAAAEPPPIFSDETSAARAAKPVSIAGGALDIGGDAQARFDDGGVDIAVFGATGVNHNGQGLHFARATLSGDANGTLSLWMPSGAAFSATDSHLDGLLVTQCPINHGIICWPEPATGTIIWVALMGWGMRPRREPD